VPPPRHLRTPNNDRDHDSDNDSVEETQIPLTPAQMRVAASERMREHRAWLTNLKAREGSNPLPATNQKKPPAAVASKAAGDDELAAKEASVKSPRGVAGEVLSEARRDYDARRRRHSANMLTTPKQFDLSTTNSATTSASATPRRTPPARSMRRYKSAPITFADNATGATARGTVRNSSAAAPVDGSGTATPGRAADDDSDSTATVPASAASQQTLQEKVPKKDGSIQRVLFSDDLTNATPRRPPPTLSSTMPSTLPFDSKERAVPRPRNGNGGSNSKKNSKKNNKINSNNNSSINSNKNNKNSNNNLSSSEGLSAAAGIRRERRPLQPSSSLPPPPPPPSSLPPSSPLLLRSPSSPCPLGGQTDSSAASRRGRLDRGEEGVRPKPSLGNNASSGKAFRSRSLTGVESKRSDEQDESDEHDDDDDVDVDDDVEYFDVGKCDPPPPPLPLPSPHPLHRASSALGKLITSPISGVLRKRPTEKKTPNKRTTVSQDNVQNNVQDNVQDNAQDSNNAGRRSWSEANKTKGSREVAVKEEVEGDVKESTELLQEWGARQPAPQQQQQQQQPAASVVLPRRLPPAVVHCFTGSPEEAAWYVGNGFFLGFAGTVCQRERGRHLREKVLPLVPLDRILLETDAPFMHPGPDYDSSSPSASPVLSGTATGGTRFSTSAAVAGDSEEPGGKLEPPPSRGKRRSHGGQRRSRERCEPRHVVDVCAAVAAAKSVSFSEVAAASTANARKIFGLCHY